jgi:hypothetical protein
LATFGFSLGTRTIIADARFCQSDLEDIFCWRGVAWFLVFIRYFDRMEKSLLVVGPLGALIHEKDFWLRRNDKVQAMVETMMGYLNFVCTRQIGV